MSSRTRDLGLVLALSCWPAACGPSAPAGAAVAQQAVSVTLLVDGSVEVREVLTVTFAEPVTWFERHVPLERADAYFDARVSLDGRPVDAATRPATAEIETADGLRVRWAFPESAGTTREFVLEYRASNAVSVHGANGLLYWRLLPMRPALPVVSSRVTFTVADGIAFMVPPTIDATARVSVDAEREVARLSAWRTEPAPSGLTASRSGIGSREEAFLWARLVADTMALAEPAWQYDAARAEELKLAWLAGGAFMVVIGAGVLVMMAVLYPSQRGRARKAGPAAGVEALAPAMADRLRRRRRGRASREIGAALRGLEARGAIRFDRPASSSGSREGETRVALVDPPAEILEHERVLLDELWLGRAQGGSDASDLLRAPGRLRRKFARALTRDLVAAGYATADRVTAADGLRLATPAIIVVALLCAAAVRLWLHRFGVWPYAVPVGIGLMGLMLLPYAATFPTLTDAGERASLALGRRR